MKQRQINYRFMHIEKSMLSILLRTLNNTIYNDLIKTATFTNLKLTSDFSYVTVYVDSFKHDKIDCIVKLLNEAKGVFRTSLAKQLSIRKIPEIIFIKDKSIDLSIEINNALEEIHKIKK